MNDTMRAAISSTVIGALGGAMGKSAEAIALSRGLAQADMYGGSAAIRVTTNVVGSTVQLNLTGYIGRNRPGAIGARAV